jgi:uncharacterized repeat protein (TIGR01451 family)
MPGRLPELWRFLAKTLLAGGVLTALLSLGGCGGSNSQLLIALTGNKGPIKPGDLPSYTVRVVNRGPASASGVTVRVNLPPSMNYNATTSLPGAASRSVRTRPEDPATKSSAPTWGTWVLPGPTTLADGKVVPEELDIGFNVTVTGTPGDYDMVPEVLSDSSDGQVTGQSLKVSVIPAPSLTVTVAAEQPMVHAGQELDYRVIVANTGSGQVAGLNVLITLPSPMVFVKTDSVSGNSSRATVDDPVAGSLVVRYGGWIVPAGSDAGPGLLTIRFKVHCAQGATAGRYTVTGQLTDQTGFVKFIDETAPVTVIAPVSPTPRPFGQSPTPRPSPSSGD